VIIVNADDWGRSERETDVSLECYRLGKITSVTAMVFMADSRRAAEIAVDQRIPTGLHLNFSESFPGIPSHSTLAQHHQRVVGFLRSRRLNQLFYNPLLTRAFEYVFRAQVEEFERLYGKVPTHFDGHQHMHLCGNMLAACLIPKGEKVRRSFSFLAGEKSFVNRAYRRLVNRRLATRYRLADYFFALSQNRSVEKFSRICHLASAASVELMTHPAIPAEEAFLKSPAYEEQLQGISRISYVEL
jgi:predicted glycoside hydrolase/deacetylase ChbG (UPF0249 family)